MTRAIQAYIEDEYKFLEGVKRGIEAADRAEVTSHNRVAAEFDRLLESHDA